MRSLRWTALLALGFAVSIFLSGCFFNKRVAAPKPQAGGPASISGVVRNSDGVPLPEVTVSVQGTSLQAETGLSGAFEIKGAPTGQVSLAFAKADFILAVRTVEVGGGGPMVADVILAPLDSALHNGLLAAKGITTKCQACHVVHKTPLLLASTVNDLCFVCHQSGQNRGFSRATFEATAHSPTFSTNSSTLPVWEGMEPGDRGYCTTCHNPHGVSGTRVMLKAGDTTKSNGACLTCHAADGTGNTARWPGSSRYAVTTNLHNNPPLPGNGTLRIYPGKSYPAGDCLNCHAPHGTTDGGALTPAMTRKKDEKLCMECHTGFKARIPAGTTVRHKCSMCHNPHTVETGNKWLIQPGTGKTQRTTDSAKDSYRNQYLLSNAYCTGCHYAGNTFGAPLYTNSVFKDIRFASNVRDYDLHNVHIDGISYGWGTVPGAEHGDRYDPKDNRLRCVDCHDVHPTTGVSGRGRLLRADRTTWISLSAGKYNGKASCGTAYPCHYDSYYGTYQQRSCDWCHGTTSGGAGAPGFGCTTHGYSWHMTTTWYTDP